MIIATRLALALTLSGASLLAVANAIADAPTSNAVVTLPIAADIANIGSRTGDGKLDTFFDTAGRKFVVLYDAAPADPLQSPQCAVETSWTSRLSAIPVVARSPGLLSPAAMSLRICMARMACRSFETATAVS